MPRLKFAKRGQEWWAVRQMVCTCGEMWGQHRTGDLYCWRCIGHMENLWGPVADPRRCAA